MITVAILINGQPLVARSARNMERKQGDYTNYRCDDGSIILHDRKDGAIVLAKKMLDTVKEI